MSDVWTTEDGRNFAAFVRERGGKVIEGHLRFDGGWSGVIRLPAHAQDDKTWSDEILAEFEEMRIGMRKAVTVKD